MACFPQKVHPTQVIGEAKDWGRMATALAVAQWRDGTLNDVLYPHKYPHLHPTSAWRLIPHTIAYETQKIAATWASLPAHVNDVPGPCTIVQHIRCNEYILQWHNDYGILPNRFLLDQIPPDTNEVVMVRLEESVENACLWSMMDLTEALQQKMPGLKVTSRSSPAWESDWLFMARAKTLFCAPSSFCLSAAWANPNKVYLATNGLHTSVVTDAPSFRQRGIISDSLLTSEDVSSGNTTGIFWVHIDYLPGKTAKNMSRDAILNYTRSAECHPELHGCIPTSYVQRK